MNAEPAMTPANPNKALWEKGDFTQIAAFMRESGEALVKSIGVKPAMRVLDLGCGDGTTAVPMARLGADVLGIDIARNLVDAGNKRAAALGLSNLKFQRGDACNLQGVADARLICRCRFSARCSLRSLLTWRRKWSALQNRAGVW